MSRGKDREDIRWWTPLIAVLAFFIGFAKGLADGAKPPPGDRRG